MSYVKTTCLSVSPHLTYCQQLNCVADFDEILLHVQDHENVLNGIYTSLHGTNELLTILSIFT
jgi:hypothetical protein